MSVRIITGDARAELAHLLCDTFDCCVTSPPYWGLRDYGVAGQIGLEPTLQEYLAEMVSIFREVRRTLKPSGTFWLNIGDSYAREPGKGGSGPGGKNTAEMKYTGAKTLSGLKPKDLAMVPNRLAIALQEDGWFVRSEIIWHKPNPMPESVTDRPTSSHEKIWLLTKSERYFYDADAVKEAAECDRVRGPAEHADKKSTNGNGGLSRRPISEFRNGRNVWTIATQPFAGAHFATMAPDLAERCIKAGSPLGGHVLDPFGGAGTTGLVADRLGRDATLIELNPGYAALARGRIEGDAPLFAEVAQ